ncbi:FtsQ-type POTRA domain-containing protein [Candidatus Pelagibacter sp.]|nr:FtsQ-type POTRA domain-containing protein [Candidatus Pelagibacter sp.]
MHQRISKKIIIYLFFFTILVTVNNINFLSFNLPQISNFTISGLNNFEKKEFEDDLNFLRNKSIISIDREEVSKKIYSNKIIEDLFIFKKYPSELKIIIKKTNFLAITKKNNQDYYIGSNGNFVLTKSIIKDLPFIFGDVEPEEFLKFKLYIDKSKFDFNQIKNLFFFKSKRWNIETKKGIIIKLPLNQIDLSLNILTKIMNDEQFKNKKIIDLRNNGQIIIND